ncbi:MAG: anti-sigma factor [Chloroflexota bacterium]|nr:anti-sigma factor [Chloroflexota bacterium]
MMRIDCAAARDDIDAYALGALDADELPAFEAHIAACADCSRLVGQARDTAAALALAVPLVPASAALKARVMASAAVLSSPGDRPRVQRRWWLAAAAALVALSAGALTWGAVMQRRADDLRAQDRAIVAQATETAGQLAALRRQQATDVSWQDGMILIASRADVRRTDLAGTALAPDAHGTYVWSAAEAMGAFLGTGLPPLPAGKTYQLWFVYAGAWESAGTAAPAADGRATLVVRRSGHDGPDPGPLRGFAVTIEPAGGTADRTGATVLQSSGLH